MTYLDYNAGAPIRPEALRAAQTAISHGGNPSSPHEAGRRAREIIEEARDKIAALLHADAEHVIFTSGGTEANHLAFGLAHAAAAKTAIVSEIEHPSLLKAAQMSGLEILTVAPDKNGIVSAEPLQATLAQKDAPCFVSVMLANNETGALQPVRQIAQIVREAGGIFHTDAAQAADRIPMDIQSLGADAVSLSGHKIGAPSGIGALVLARDLPLKPLLHGGGQERSLRAGTENLGGIAGFGAAAESAADLKDQTRIQSLRDRMEEIIKNADPNAVIFSENAPRLPNTSAFALPSITAQASLIRFDLEEVRLSAGSACSSGKIAPSHVLAAMGAPPRIAASALRASLGWNSSEEDVERFGEAIRKILHHENRREAAE